MDWDGMSNLYRGPSIDASYQVSVHLTRRFQKRRILKINQSETRVACGIAHFVPIDLQTWPPQAILVSVWLISKISSLLKKDNF
jgi:hypothetical protein